MRARLVVLTHSYHAYRHLCNELGLNSTEHVFFDDNGNVLQGVNLRYYTFVRYGRVHDMPEKVVELFNLYERKSRVDCT